MSLTFDLILAYIVLLLLCGTVLRDINSTRALREQHMTAAMLVSGATMAFYLHYTGFPYSLVWIFAAALSLPWLLYRLLLKRPEQTKLWDTVDFRAHALCLAVAAMASIYATGIFPITAHQVAAMCFSYLIAWLLLFPL
jgi:hypothetical protein